MESGNYSSPGRRLVGLHARGRCRCRSRHDVEVAAVTWSGHAPKVAAVAWLGHTPEVMVEQVGRLRGGQGDELIGLRSTGRGLSRSQRSGLCERWKSVRNLENLCVRVSSCDSWHRKLLRLHHRIHRKLWCLSGGRLADELWGKELRKVTRPLETSRIGAETTRTSSLSPENRSDR